MKKRKFLSLFAILFVAIFALSICFFAACKGGDDDEDNSGDNGTQQDGGDTGTGEGAGSGNENEGQTRTGDHLDANDEIIGTWTGSTEIKATIIVFSGTITAEMTAKITDEYFSLAFTPTEIDLGSLSSYEEYLEAFGIGVGIEFDMFTDEPIYKDDDGYFVDINGTYVTCQLPVEIVDGLLSISFHDSLNFGIDVGIDFDAELYSEAELAIEKVIYVADKELTYTLDDDTTATFANDSSLSIRTKDGINYAVSGPASKMGEAEATYYGTDDIQEGALYVVLKIAVPEGGSITFGYSQKTYVNSESGDPDEFDEDGYIYVIQALRDEDDDGVYDERDFTIKTGEEGDEGTKYTVTFEGVTEPVEEVTRSVSISVSNEIVETLTLEVGQEATLVAAVTMSDGSNYGTFDGSSWTSSDPSVATVEIGSLLGQAVYRNGVVTAVGAGTTEITITIAEGETATVVVTVNAPLVKIHDGEAEISVDGGSSVIFANAHELAISTSTTEEGGKVCSVEGMATLMTEEQSAALNGDSTNYTAFVVIEIPAAAGSTITYGSETITVAADATFAVIVQGLTASGNETVTMKTGEDNEFTISFDNVTVPDDVIEGVWSGRISAAVKFDETEYTATMNVEITIETEGKLTIVISDIDLNDEDANASLSENVTTITLTGTWQSTDDGGYTVSIDAKTGTILSPNSVSVTDDAELALEMTADEESGETQIKISFGVEYEALEVKIIGGSTVLATVEITVADAVLDMD